MKIQCDVCNAQTASFYCSADEAALCSACDHSVHHANKLAGKHNRFSLLLPSPSYSPMCDICQDKIAFLFCQQDRAILCKDCDLAIHKVNQHTLAHHRFLLTGVRVAPATALNDVVPDPKPLPSGINQQANGSAPGSTISEYLIEMLPGWHVEDFLDPTPNFSKVGDNDPASFWGGDMGGLDGSFSPESMGIWVPQAPAPAPARCYDPVQRFEPGSNMGFGSEVINGSSIVFDSNNQSKMNTDSTKSSRKWASDNRNCFTVPQISPYSTSSKRSRTLWQ